MKKDTIVDGCLKHWEYEDEKTLYFQNNIKNWTDTMSTDMKQIVYELLNQFDYFSHERVNNIMVHLHEKVLRLGNITDENSVYSVLQSQRRTMNSSFEYCLEYKRLNRISKYIVYPNISEISNESLKYIDNFIFIDDYCGSGKTFTDYIDSVKHILSEKRIIYVIVYIMQDAINRINNYIEKTGIDIKICYYCKGNKAFDLSDLRVKKSIFIKESKNKKIGNNYIMGLWDTQSLTSFYNDTPNNTLGIFWYDTSFNKSIFPRNKDNRPSWQNMKKNRESRRLANYIVKKREHKNE